MVDKRQDSLVLLLEGELSSLRRLPKPQVSQTRYMSSSALTFALLRNSNDFHIYKDLYGEQNEDKKNEKLIIE